MDFCTDEKEEFFPCINNIGETLKDADKKELEDLIDEISKYDVFDFISRVASLNLLIENQNKSILIDALIAGILMRELGSYPSSIQMSSGRFRKIIERLDSLNIHRLVDPVENTFIERVCYYGNYWIFPGINYSPAYCLQGFLDVICSNNLELFFEFKQKAHQLICFILKISDDIVKIMGYGVSSIKSVEQSNLQIPGAVLAEKMRDCMYLDYSIVESMMDQSIRQKLFTDFGSGEISDIIEGKKLDFFEHPFLVSEKGEIIILNPSILIPFLIHQLILLADSFGIKEKFVDSYNDRIWRKCKNDIFKLGHKKINERQYGIDLINNSCKKELIVSVGNDRLMFIQFICDSGKNYGKDSMFGTCLIDDNTLSTYERVHYFISKLPTVNLEDISQVIILNSFGRTVQFHIEKDESRYSIHLSPFELHCVAVNEREHKEFIPRYISAKKNLNLVPGVMSSELNSIQIYTDNNYTFYISDDFNRKNTTIFFGLDSPIDYIIKSFKKEDRHFVKSYDGIYSQEVILSDLKRRIYCTDGRKDKFLEFVIKFDNVNIWVTSDSVKNKQEVDVYYSIIDTISYWLAEVKIIIESMNFLDDSICILISLDGSIGEYYKNPEIDKEFNDYIKYEVYGNTVRMIWQPIAYKLLGNKTKNMESVMMCSVLERLVNLNNEVVDLTKLQEFFSNPLKKKICEINITDNPCLKPLEDEVRFISKDEENKLLDEIGEHFLAMPEYNYGKVPDDKRAELANKVVGYLYTLLQTEVASVIPAEVYKIVCYDLENIMYNTMLLQYRFVYDITCYPEKEAELMERSNEMNRSSIALKFLAEYIAAIPPKGDRHIGSMQYDRILAICSLIVDWAYKNDLFIYNIFNTPIYFLKSDRIGMDRVEHDNLLRINLAARNRYLKNVSNPRIENYFPINLLVDFQLKINDAFFDEYGFTFEQFTQCIQTIIDYGNETMDEVKRFKRDDVTEFVITQTEFDKEVVNKIINQIVLCQRPNFLIPPEPYKPYDIYPWRFNRELSFTRRPIIQYEEVLIWGNRQLYHLWIFVVDLIMTGKYKAYKSKLKKLMGELSHKRGNEFNDEVVKKLSAIKDLMVVARLSKVNGKKITDENNNVLGDIDVFCIVPEQRKIIVGEVKDFSFAKNPYEMNQEYKRIFVDDKKPCYMTKHKKRTDWIKKHMEDVKMHFGLKGEKWVVKTAMFVSEEIISNAFYHKNIKIIVYSNITEEAVKNI